MKKMSWALLVSCAALIFMLGSCSPKNTTTAPATPVVETASIYYTVTGNLSSFYISYYTPSGYVSEQVYHSCPYTSDTYSFTSGEQMGIEVTDEYFNADATITVNTYKNGTLWKTITATIYDYGTITEDETL